ncbi:MAG: phage head spike fiber domain-containing protein, partial [Candidatus Thorarchaeota archaeon]
ETDDVITIAAGHDFEVGDKVCFTVPNGAQNGLEGNFLVKAPGGGITSTTFAIDNTAALGSFAAGTKVVNYSRNYYVGSIRTEDISGSLAGRIQMEEALRAIREDRADTAIDSGLDRQNLIDQIRERQQARDNERTQVRADWLDTWGTLGRGQWAAISISKKNFVRAGTDSTLDWSNIESVHVECYTNENAGLGDYIGIFDLDAADSKSQLNSEIGIPYDWRYTYWSDTLGIESNPSDIMPEGVDAIFQTPTLTFTGSPDGQVTHLKIYRRGGLIFNWHLVAVIDNPGFTTTTYDDKLSDLSIASQPVLRLDNHYPVPTKAVVTNHIQRSQEFNDGTKWPVQNGLTIQANTQLAPDDSQTADKITSASANGTIYQTVANLETDPLPSGDTSKYRFSFYIRREVGTRALGAVSTVHDNAGGVSWATNAITTLVDSDDGYKTGKWIRHSIEVGPPAASSISVGIRLATANDVVSIWGAQLERVRMTNAIAPNAHPVVSAYISTEDDTSGVGVTLTSYASLLSHIFGPYEGKYLFGIRPKQLDSILAPGQSNDVMLGDLFWSNPGNPDAWSPVNRVEVTSAAEPLQRGFIFNQKPFVFSTENLYAIYTDWRSPDTFLTTQTPCGVGLWARSALAIGPRIWFLGKEGIYETSGAAATNITENSPVRPLFNGEAVNGYNPVDFFQGYDT